MRRVRFLAVLGAFVLLVIGGTAWFLGGPRTTGTETRQGLAGVDARLPADGVRDLSVDDVHQLRADGWTCPDLRTAGYWIESAELTERAGAPAVVADLRSSSHTLTVVEQHPGETGTDAGTSTDEGVMTDGLTGSAVTAATFERSERDGTAFWVARSSGGGRSDVVFQVGDAVYSLRADAAAADAVRVATVIATTDRARVTVPGPGHTDSLLGRLSRGLGRLLGGGS